VGSFSQKPSIDTDLPVFCGFKLFDIQISLANETRMSPALPVAVWLFNRKFFKQPI